MGANPLADRSAMRLLPLPPTSALATLGPAAYAARTVMYRACRHRAATCACR
jgi:hypothetical protein